MTGKNLGGPKGDGESLRPQGERKGGRKNGGKKRGKEGHRGGERWRCRRSRRKECKHCTGGAEHHISPPGPCLDWVSKLGLYPRVLDLPGESEVMNVRSKNRTSGPGLGRRGARGFSQLSFSTVEELLFDRNQHTSLQY